MGFIIYSITNTSHSLLKRSLVSETQSKLLQKTNQIMEEANEQKTNFIINITHETKTPLTLIDNYLKEYIKKYGAKPELKIVRENINKLITDFVNIMDAEKLNKGMDVFDDNKIINFSLLLKKKLELYQPYLKNHNLQLQSQIEEDIYVKADDIGLERMINNLMDNAVKYSKQEGTIFIQLTKEKDQVNFICKDDGIGIESSHLKNIFTPYYQIRHQKKNTQGIGMGLFIVKKILDHINGQISVDSTLGKGSTFKVTLDSYHLQENDLPFQYTDFTAPNLSSAMNLLEIPITKDSQKRNLLIIEDNSELLTYLINSLKDEFNIYYGMNGAEALELLKTIPTPDLILSDIMMDEMDGIELFKAIKKHLTLCRVPFIFLTAKNSEEEKIDLLAQGAVDFISKPFSIEVLKHKIQSIIEIKSNQIDVVKDQMMDFLTQIKKQSPEVQPDSTTVFHQCCDKYDITPREKEVIELLIEGKLNKEIGLQLNIAENTVKNIINKIYEKTEVKNKVELTNLFRNYHVQ